MMVPLLPDYKLAVQSLYMYILYCTVYTVGTRLKCLHFKRVLEAKKEQNHTFHSVK
jgi:hypothetical protein